MATIETRTRAQNETEAYEQAFGAINDTRGSNNNHACVIRVDSSRDDGMEVELISINMNKDQLKAILLLSLSQLND